MDFLLTATLFVLLTGLTTALGVKLWARPRSAMERITGTVAEPETHVPVHPSLVFRELVVKLGALLPMDVSKSGLIQRRLIRAGYRTPRPSGCCTAPGLAIGVDVAGRHVHLGQSG